MRNLTRFTVCHDQICAGHGSPRDIGRAGASPAIDAMTIAQLKWPTFQHVSCAAANASTSELHMISLILRPSLPPDRLGPHIDPILFSNREKSGQLRNPWP